MGELGLIAIARACAFISFGVAAALAFLGDWGPATYFLLSGFGLRLETKEAPHA